MNILIDDVNNVVAERIKIPFNTDFRYSIMFELLMQDTSLSDEEKILTALQIYYPEFNKITDFQKAMLDIMWFYGGGKEDGTIENKRKTVSRERVNQIYSYEFDADYIYSAFLDQYNINLQKDMLHWWEFRALFQGLKDDNKIVEIMGYRGLDLSKIKDKEEKARYKRLKKIYALPDMRTQEQKDADFAAAFLN